MSRLSSIAGVAAFALVQLAWASADQRPNTALIAQELLQAAYPELVNEKLTIRVTQFGDWPTHREWFPTVTIELVRPRRPESSATSEPLLLRLVSDFDIHGHVFKAKWTGAKAESEAMSRMKQFAAANSELTDGALVAELKRRGARFGPADVSEPPIATSSERFDAVLGRTVKSSVQFVVRAKSSDEDPPDFPFEWQIVRETIHSDDRPGCYILVAEPFSGSLIYIQRC